MKETRQRNRRGKGLVFNEEARTFLLGRATAAASDISVCWYFIEKFENGHKTRMERL